MPSETGAPPTHLTLDDVLFLHAFAVTEFGGVPGVGNHEALDVALRRPVATFQGEPYYGTGFLRAAALAHSILVHTPFAHANARTAIYVMAAWLEREGYRIRTSGGQLRYIANALREGLLTVPDVAGWLESYSTPLVLAPAITAPRSAP